jgi:hypothetical protein
VSDDESAWSTRYYAADCPDIQITVTTDGPDDRPDPTEDGARCLIQEHGVHRLTRISPAAYDWLRFGEDADDDEDDDEIEWADDDPRWEPT